MWPTQFMSNAFRRISLCIGRVPGLYGYRTMVTVADRLPASDSAVVLPSPASEAVAFLRPQEIIARVLCMRKEARHACIADPRPRDGDPCDRPAPLERGGGWRRAAGRRH